ncbi:MAG: hypothetical protein M0T70_09680 [Geobacteraceae bacterium]|nr:hypothetical protein [Geobacteraceae bacterium]
MAGKSLKTVLVTILDQQHLRGDWLFDFNGEMFRKFISDMTSEMRKLGVDLTCIHNHDVVISINSYADLLNCVKISSDDSLGNHCIGHVIGKSEHLNILEDIDAAVRRVAFAPETIAPAGEFRKVCHNCGCGC